MHSLGPDSPLGILIGCCLSSGFIAVKRRQDQGNSSKEKRLVGLAHSFGGSVHYHHGKGKRGSVQLLEDPRVLHHGPKAARRNVSFYTEQRTSKPMPTMMHFLQQEHTS